MCSKRGDSRACAASLRGLVLLRRPRAHASHPQKRNPTSPHPHGGKTGEGFIIRGVAKSIVNLPPEVREPYEVFVNGVPQRVGEDFQAKGRTLMFQRELRKDKISKRRWLLGAWGVGTYKQDDSVDVRYEAADGSPRVAEALEIESA
jgi:hypothetical protein